jgi:hypothetical protein
MGSKRATTTPQRISEVYKELLPLCMTIYSAMPSTER